MVRESFTQQDIAQQRHQRQRENQRRDQRGRHRIGHRRENAPLVPLQRKDRDVRGDNDQHREERRPPDFDRRVEDHAQAVPVLASVDLVVMEFLRLGQFAKDVFHHDHGAVDDDAEVHRAERQQIGRNADPGQAEKSAEQRQRNHQRDDGGRAQVAEEQQQYQHHQHGALDEVGEYRLEGLADEPRAVVIRHQRDALRQHRLVQHVDALLDGGQHRGRVLALAHQHHAGDDVVVVVLADHALARHRADG